MHDFADNMVTNLYGNVTNRSWFVAILYHSTWIEATPSSAVERADERIPI